MVRRAALLRKKGHEYNAVRVDKEKRLGVGGGRSDAFGLFVAVYALRHGHHGFRLFLRLCLAHS